MSEEKKKKPRVKDMELVPVQDGLQEENSIDLYELLLKTEVVQKGRCVFYVINEKSAELTKLLMQNIAG